MTTDGGPALVRRSSDVRVLDALLDHAPLSRSALATLTGLSRPTAAASVLRLAERGVAVETGERTTGRGRSAPLVGLADTLGCALVLVVDAAGVAARLLDVKGRTLAETHEDPRDTFEATLAHAARRVAGSARVRIAAVSVADPVDRRSGVAVRLPDEPFLVGRLDPVAALAGLVPEPEVHVDNDVNWMARRLVADDPGSFVVLYLGEGLGGAVVEDGTVVRGHDGLAGEVAHLWVPGPGGVAMPLVDLFARLGLHRPGSTAIDVTATRTALTTDADTRRIVATALAAALESITAFLDPGHVALTGPWATVVLDALGDAAGRNRRPVPVRLFAGQDDDPALAGAQAGALAGLRRLVMTDGVI